MFLLGEYQRAILLWIEVLDNVVEVLIGEFFDAQLLEEEVNVSAAQVPLAITIDSCEGGVGLKLFEWC